MEDVDNNGGLKLSPGYLGDEEDGFFFLLLRSLLIRTKKKGLITFIDYFFCFEGEKEEENGWVKSKG
ncbi:hypothetical protein GQ457_16G003670 [Hibiscus cannabinus]